MSAISATLALPGLHVLPIPARPVAEWMEPQLSAESRTVLTPLIADS